MNLNRSKESQTPLTENKLELKLNIKDLESLQDAFSLDGEGHNNLIRLNGEQFVEALSLVLCKGTREEYADLFDKIDITREGYVDWEKFASHMLLEFYEKDDRSKSSSIPQWKELKTLSGPHKDVIQRITLIKNLNRYLTISKEGNVALWGSDLKLQKQAKTNTESCRSRDLWVTDFAYLSNINKIAVSFTSKEISFYDMNMKLEFSSQVKLENLMRIPICMDYWNNSDSNGEAILAWGDTGGFINVLLWSCITSSLFERVTSKVSDKDENMITISLMDIMHGNIKMCTYFFHKAHQDWVRKLSYLPNLECFVSCATNWNTSMVISWMEKYNPMSSSSSEMAGVTESRGISRTSVFTVHQGINSFAYNDTMNLIATAGVNFQVCLWNPYVTSKPNGLLRGHMAAVTDVQFNKARGHLLSFSKDKILRIWDVQLQVCIQRLAGVFPKGQEMYSKMYYHEDKLRLFITFNFGLTMLEMKPDMKDKISSHEKPLIGCLYNSLYNQVVTACQGGIIYCWMVDTGQRVKTISEICGPQAELTCITQDYSQTRLYTGATDGYVKIWDFNGHCYNSLIVADGNPADISQIVILKRCILAFGFSKKVTAFWTSSFKDHKVFPSPWNGVQTHKDDILSGTSIPPHAVATGSYDGEIIIWNINSEQASRTMTQRTQDTMKDIRELGENITQEPPPLMIKNETMDDIKKSELKNSINMDIMFNISRLIYLESRKKVKHGGGANLISCGGNGIVRFWNSAEGWLIGEFIAHENASNIIMNTDSTNQYLITGDMDGYLKVWDIQNYCMNEGQYEKLFDTPSLLSNWQSHSDEISGIAFCSKFNRTLVITSSADQSAALWEITGQIIGRFGQEHRWKLSAIIENASMSALETHDDEVVQEETDYYVIDKDWAPDPDATLNPSKYRINTWETTNLGKDYQELRIKKRERIQPSSIPDLPYLFGDKLGRPTFGPFYSLNIANFEEVEEIEQPEFMEYPEKFFNETDEYLLKTTRVTLSNETLKAVFDERSLLPKYILDFEHNFRSRFQRQFVDVNTKIKSTVEDNSNNVTEIIPRRIKQVRLKPIQERSKYHKKLTQKLDIK